MRINAQPVASNARSSLQEKNHNVQAGKGKLHITILMKIKGMLKCTTYFFHKGQGYFKKIQELQAGPWLFSCKFKLKDYNSLYFLDCCALWIWCIAFFLHKLCLFLFTLVCDQLSLVSVIIKVSLLFFNLIGSIFLARISMETLQYTLQIEENLFQNLITKTTLPRIYTLQPPVLQRA